MRGRRAVRSPQKQTAATTVLAVAIASSLLAGPGLEGVFGAFLAALVLAIALIDARYFLIPNELTAAAAALALLRAGVATDESSGLAIALAGARGLGVAMPFALLMLAYRKWRGRDGLGFGDVKLAGVAGLWLGWSTVFIAIELAALAAIAAYFAVALVRRERYRAAALLPFGLFLAPAIWVGWLLEKFV